MTNEQFACLIRAWVLLLDCEIEFLDKGLKQLPGDNFHLSYGIKRFKAELARASFQVAGMIPLTAEED